MHLTSIRAIRAAFSGILLASAVCVVGCSGSNNGGGSPAPTPSATISPSTASMTAGATQTVTATVTNPNTTVTCGFSASSGSFGAATLSGSTCAAVYTASATITVTTTATLSFTGGGATATPVTVTINPVTPTLSWVNTNLTIAIPGNATDAGASLVVSSSVLSGAGACAASAGGVTITVVPTNGNTTVVAGNSLASFTADSTHATYGTLYAGNTFTQDKVNTYTVAAICGSLTANATLTVTDPAPIITSVSPAIVKALTPVNFVLTGTGFISNNSSTGTQWQGTMAGSVNGACPTPATAAMLAAGTSWTKSTQIGQGDTGDGIGSWSYYAINGATSTGTGGGFGCLANAYQVTATGMVKVGIDLVTVNVGGNTLSVTSDDVTTGFLLPNKGAGEPTVIGHTVYVPDGNVISALDTSSNQLSAIRISANLAAILTTTDGMSLYVAAKTGGKNSTIGIYRLETDHSLTLLATTGAVYDMKATANGEVLWVTSTGLNMLDTRTGAQHLVQLSAPADSIAMLSDGTVVVYCLGQTTETVVNPATFTEAGTTAFAKGILGFNDDAFSLVDGNIGRVALNSETGKLVWTQLGTFNEEDLLGGFTLSFSAKEKVTVEVHTAHRVGDGSLVMQAQTVHIDQ